MEKLKLINQSDGIRLDQFLAQQKPEYSRTFFQKRIEAGEILVNGQVVKPNHRLQIGDRVEGSFSSDMPLAEIAGEDIPLEIIYEDSDVIVINKQPGLVVHPGSGNQEGTLVNALINYFPQIREAIYSEKEVSKMRPGLVHRLDKDTSGVMIVAKNERAMHSLACQIQNRTVVKKYIALCFGWPKDEHGRLVNYLGRDPKNRQKMADIGKEKGKEAISDFQVVKYFEDNDKRKLSLIEFCIQTGRTHQIRIQASLNHFPVIGDAIYGSKESTRFSDKLQVARQLLHAKSLQITLPGATKQSSFEAPLPLDFKTTLEMIKKEFHTFS